MAETRRRPKLILSPFTETAISQLLAEYIQTESNKIRTLEGLRRIRDMVKARIESVANAPAKKKKKQIRNPNWPSSIRAAEWFRKNRREVRDEAAGTPNPYLEQ
jgi:hypothetical protein